MSVKIALQMNKNDIPAEPMAAILKIVVFLGLPPPKKKNQEGHRSSFLRPLSKVTETTEKMSFNQKGYGIQKNDPTIPLKRFMLTAGQWSTLL